MIALGLLLLTAAAIVALVGVLANVGGAHALNSDFSLFGYHLHGSTGQLLLIGVIVGAVGMLGLTMLLAGLGRGSPAGPPPGASSTDPDARPTRCTRNARPWPTTSSKSGRPGWPPSRVPAAAPRHRLPTRPGTPPAEQQAGAFRRNPRR